MPGTQKYKMRAFHTAMALGAYLPARSEPTELHWKRTGGAQNIYRLCAPCSSSRMRTKSRLTRYVTM